MAEATSPGEEIKFLAILIEEAVDAETERCAAICDADEYVNGPAFAAAIRKRVR